MNAAALVFVVLNSGAILLLPRRWVTIPLLATCCYMSVGLGIELGSISLPIFRIVLAFGIFRVILRREAFPGPLNAVDKLMITMGIWLVFASFFHEQLPGSGLQFTTGVVVEIVSIYFLTRIWCRDLSDLFSIIEVVAWLLVPVAVAMVAEHVLKINFFAVLGDLSGQVYVRDGKIRAQGPFQHPILAGTVGAVCFPLMVGIWQRHRLSSVVGMTASAVMVFASTSSGPLMSLLLGAAAIVLWKRRSWLPAIRWSFIILYIFAELLMSRPAYYLISKIDLTGSSTSWYRSRLIESAFEHLSEWWLFGADITAHWMPIPLNSRQADLTNYYIYIGTLGGLPALLIMVAIFWRCFKWVGRGVVTTSAMPQWQFMIWCLGAALFAHAATSISVAYFDQSKTFLWLNIGIISSMFSILVANAERALTTAERAYARSPGVPAIADAYGWMLVQHRRNGADGVEILAAAAQRSPGDGDIQYHYAHALAQTGRATAAIGLLRLLLQSGTRFEARREAQQLLIELGRDRGH